MYDEKPKKEDAPSYTWQQVWTAVLTNPATETFEDILRDVNASPGRAYKWIAVASVISMVIQSFTNPGFTATSAFLGLLCAVIFVPLFVILGTMISASITQFIANRLGGIGTYREFVYAYGAIAAPMALVSALVGIMFRASPGLGAMASFILSIYSFILTGMALRAVNQFSWGRAISTMLIPTIIVIFFVICLIISFAPSLGEIYDGIILTLTQEAVGNNR